MQLDKWTKRRYWNYPWCYYHVTIMPLSCHYHATIMSLSCHYHATIMSLSCHYHGNLLNFYVGISWQLNKGPIPAPSFQYLLGWTLLLILRRLQDHGYLKTLTLTLKKYSLHYFNSLAILGLAFLNIVF